MIDICSSPDKPHTRNPRRLGMGFLRFLGVILLASMLAVSLIFTMGHARVSEAGRAFLSSLIYSTCIGVPCAASLSWITHRYYERFPRAITLIQLLAMLTAASLGSALAGIVLQLTHIRHPGQFMAEFRGAFPFALIITLVIGFSFTSYEMMQHKLQAASLELRAHQMEQERAYKLLAEARLSSLESRIHPHFLFNTLNSIAALIPVDPKHAEDTVGKLASLLRFSLNANHSGLVPLRQELKIVRDYLEIESTRFNARLRYSIDVPDDLLDIRTPPLALQSLVENTIKHVVSPRPQGASVRIAGVRTADKVRLEVIDDGPGFSLQSITPEHGLGNLVGRLELLFGDRAQLSVARRDDLTVVSLEFPVE